MPLYMYDIMQSSEEPLLIYMPWVSTTQKAIAACCKHQKGRKKTYNTDANMHAQYTGTDNSMANNIN
jgi:hypothetical protein